MFAHTPEPPYWAVIFSSQRTGDDIEGYAAMAERMVELAHRQPGFLGLESVRGQDGFGITAAYFESLEAIHAWGAQAEHREAQRFGRERWYEAFKLRICRVESERRFLRDEPETP